MLPAGAAGPVHAHPLVVMRRATRAQLEAGNYPHRHITFQGLPVTIENPRGTIRSGEDPHGAAWSTGMPHHYGYLKGTLGVDGDHLDVVVGPVADATHAYVITTRKAPEFLDPDEQKCMLGFASEHQACEAFQEMYDDPRHFGELAVIPMEEFKRLAPTTRAEPRMLKAAPLLLLRYKGDRGCR